MAHNKNSLWTDELRSEVKDMWRTHSAKDIAVALQQRGYAVTRCSIIGVVHRAGLTLEHKSADRQRRVSPPKREKRERKMKPVLRLISGAGLPVFKTIMIPDLDIACADVESCNVSLMDLGKNECRYPYGDGPFTFCGHSTDGGSYCAGHAALCYIPSQRRMAA